MAKPKENMNDEPELIEGWEALKLFKEGVKVQTKAESWPETRWSNIDKCTHIFNADGWQFRRKPEPVRARMWVIGDDDSDIMSARWSNKTPRALWKLREPVEVIELTSRIREILQREGEL